MLDNVGIGCDEAAALALRDAVERNEELQRWTVCVGHVVALVDGAMLQ